jgi:hypothetical protein
MGCSAARHCGLLKIVGTVYLTRDGIHTIAQEHADMADEGSIALGG